LILPTSTVLVFSPGPTIIVSETVQFTKTEVGPTVEFTVTEIRSKQTADPNATDDQDTTLKDKPETPTQSVPFVVYTPPGSVVTSVLVITTTGRPTPMTPLPVTITTIQIASSRA
jgi:hypothetical protein